MRNLRIIGDMLEKGQGTIDEILARLDGLSDQMIEFERTLGSVDWDLLGEDIDEVKEQLKKLVELLDGQDKKK